MTPPHAISPLRYAFGAFASLAAAGLAACALIRLASGAPLLATLIAGSSPMKPAVAVAILCASTAWLALHARAAWAGALGLALTGATAAAAGAGLVEHLSGVDLGAALAIPADGGARRIGVAAGASLLFSALALALTRSASERAEDVRQFARVAGLSIPLFAIALLIYDPFALDVIHGFEGVSLDAAMALGLVLLAIGFDRPVASLRWQIAHVGVAVIAPLAALTIHFASAERESALSRAEDRLAATARLVAERQEGVIEQARQMLIVLGRSGGARQPSPACETSMAEFMKLNPSVRAMFTIGREGMIRCATMAGLTSVVVGDRDYVRGAFDSGGFSVSNFFLSRPHGDPRIAVALPDPIDPDLIVAASLDLAALGDPLDRELGDGVTSTLIDGNGVVIARRPERHGLIGRSIADAEFAARALVQSDRAYVAPELDGRQTVFVARRLLSGHSTLIIGVPRKDVVGPVDRRLNDRLLLIAAILTASIALGVLGGELLVLRPLRRLIAYARRLEAGDLTARPEIGSSGEVRALGRALSATAGAIESRERRLAETEALFRRLFEHSPDATAVVRVDSDGDFRIETWNDAAARFSGLAARDVVGRRPRDVFPDSRGASLEHDLRRTVEQGGVTTIEREPIVNGMATVFEMVQAPLYSPEGSIERIFVSARDISERKRVERLKNEFVSTVSHELRTPLTSIAGSLGLLAGGAAGTLGAKAAGLIAIAHSNSLRLVRLINEILDIEKIEAGRMTFETTTLQVADLVNQAVAELKGYAHGFGVSVDVVPSGGELLVRGDPDRLSQVVTNLLSNAIKFSPPGEVVTVSLRTEGDVVVLSVDDRGPGVPQAFRSRLFTKFAQADSSDSRRRGGTGLGLAIVREIVDRHAGAVSYRANEFGGAVFEVRLPRRFEGEGMAASAGGGQAGAPTPHARR
ncbi:sensor histidine kinase [Hansschlegelia plantiphila]|uniref:histidine kinase n=1 Tax=Hansschlegelia plantiphila TaxID=374655 RepID=A0A9W6J3V2_9HYPH|nr:ATP-binding protein [Hansschlegelia plantiphila]GLK69276.1 hypothetical protein GCM10008179_29140 [Hansschlegelia plantiphila]